MAKIALLIEVAPHFDLAPAIWFAVGQAVWFSRLSTPLSHRMRRIADDADGEHAESLRQHAHPGGLLHFFFASMQVLLRVAALTVFACLFIIGPIATEFTGVGAAILLIVPILVAMWLLVAVMVIKHRRYLALTTGALCWLLIECAICPGYFANLWRRLIIGRTDASADAVVFCASTMSDPRQAEMIKRLKPYVQDLIERELASKQDQSAFARSCRLIQGARET